MPSLCQGLAVVRVKVVIALFMIASVSALGITVISSTAVAQDSEDSYTFAPPIVLVLESENSGAPIGCYSVPMVHTDDGNATLWLKIRMPHEVYNAKALGTVMWLGGHLTAVSYKASWQNNKTIHLYGGSNNETERTYKLTNIPYGDHHLEVNASCVVFILDDYKGASHPFYDSNEYSLDFTIAPNSTPTPTTQQTPTPTPPQQTSTPTQNPPTQTPTAISLLTNAFLIVAVATIVALLLAALFLIIIKNRIRKIK